MKSSKSKGRKEKFEPYTGMILPVRPIGIVMLIREVKANKASRGSPGWMCINVDSVADGKSFFVYQTDLERGFREGEK